MKILQLNKYYPPVVGGVESVVRDLSEGLVSLGSQVTALVCARSPGTPTREVIEQGVHIVRTRTLATILSMPVSFDYLQQARHYIKQTDLIVLHHPFPLGFLAYALFGGRKPLIVLYHSDIVRQRRSAWLLQGLLHFVLRRATRILVTSKNLLESSRTLQPHRERTTVTPLWTQTNLFHGTDRQRIVSQTIRSNYPRPLILSVGRLVSYKGFDVLLQAMETVDATLLIIGEGPQRESLLQEIAQEGLTDRVHILPHVVDLVPYYLAAEVFVLPSTSPAEAFGIVQLEAMASGLPVVNTRLPTGVPEVSLHEVTGLTVEPGDVRALGNAIKALLADTDLRTRYGQAAKERARTVFDQTQRLKTIDDLLRQSIDSSYEVTHQKIPLDQLAHWSQSPKLGNRRRLYLFTKRLGDLLSGMMLGVVFLLTAPVLMLLVRCSGPGPIFFHQRRVTLDGRPFTIYKYRTMKSGTATDVWTQTQDPRITKIGSWLRRTHLDELPQAWNLLRGDLSLVGPRPEQKHLVDLLSEHIPFYQVRHQVRCGITGWAQLHVYAGSVEASREKLAYDLYYLKHQSLWFDLVIILKTIRNLLRFTGT